MSTDLKGEGLSRAGVWRESKGLKVGWVGLFQNQEEVSVAGGDRVRGV